MDMAWNSIAAGMTGYITHHQLFHTSLACILSSLHLGMSEPEVALCADGLHQWVIYGLGPYIADYPKQVLITGIIQGWCPR